MKSVSEMKAKDIMRREVVSLRADMSLRQAAQILHEVKISGAPVVNDSGELIGVVSQSDLLREAVDAKDAAYFIGGFYCEVPPVGEPGLFGGVSADSTKVEDIMSPYVITAGPEDSVAVLARLLREHRFHRLIVTEGKAIVGIVSTLDLLQVIEQLEH